jgi:beta-phosphoglucomutase-like phosphatase (HAD superfamily)
VIQAVVFDLDGVLVDSEQLWDQARREVVPGLSGLTADLLAQLG